MRPLARASCALVLTVTCAAAPSPGPVAPTAAPSPVPAVSPASDGPFYRIETDTVISMRNGDFEMPHKVAFTRPGSDGTAESATGNDKKGTILLKGSVVLHDNGNAPEASTNDEYAKGGPATLTCDNLDVDSKKKIYVATGHVHFVQGTRSAVADMGTMNRSTGMLRLEGHVKTVEGASSITSGLMDYNTNTKKMEATGRPVIIKQPVPSPEPGSGTPTPKPKKRRLPI